MSYYLGIDIGTSGTKSLLVNVEGKILGEGSAEYPLHQPKPGWTEQDPEDWWKAAIHSAREAVDRAKVDGQQVKAIGLSGQMHGSVFLDKQGQVIRRALLWNDQRTSAECEEITERAGGRKQLIKLVANPALTGFTAPKILWLRNHEPKNFEKTVKVLLPKDEIRRRLTGEFAGDVSDASGTLLLNVVKRKWSKKLLEKLDLSADLLPPVFESEEVTGVLTKEAAEALGLSTACKVVAGAGDCAAGAIGNGIVEPGVLSTSIGTSGVMFVHCDQPEYDDAGRLHTFCHAVHGKWHMMGVNLSSGGSLQWWVTQILQGLIPGDGSAQGPNEGDAFARATEEAKGHGVGSGGLLFLPYLSGERTPHADPNARGCFLGLNATHQRGQMTRAVMEGVVFALRDSLQIIRELDVPVNQIRASGGGSRNPLWRQMQADIFGQNVVTLESEQGPAFGVALLAMVGDGAYRDITEACAATIKVASETPPTKSAIKKYEKLYQIYHRQYSRLKETFAELSRFE